MATQMLSVRGSKGLHCVAQDPTAAAAAGPTPWTVISKGETNAPHDESKNVKVRTNIRQSAQGRSIFRIMEYDP